MKSFEKSFLDRLTIPHGVISVIRRIGEYKGKQDLYGQQAPEVLENLRRVAIIQSTESSNRLEGITADQKRIQELIEEKATPEGRAESEIAGYRDVLNQIHINFKSIPLSSQTLLRLHKEMMKYTDKEGGVWKSRDNAIFEYYPDGSSRVRFVTVPANLTPGFMVDLHQRYSNLARENAIDPLMLIPLYVLDFLCVHPFLDGNGRMARLLSVLLLYQNEYEVGRYISLERIIEQSKQSYYDTLYRSSHGWHEGNHDASPWMEYWLSTVLAAYKEFESRIGKLTTGRGRKTEIVLNAIDGFLADFTITDLQKACPTVGRDLIRSILLRLRREGKLEPVGKGRYAKWRKIQ